MSDFKISDNEDDPVEDKDSEKESHDKSHGAQLTPEEVEFLQELEFELKHRYTEADEDYMAVLNQGDINPPVLKVWSMERRNNQQNPRHYQNRRNYNNNNNGNNYQRNNNYNNRRHNNYNNNNNYNNDGNSYSQNRSHRHQPY